MTTTEHDMDRLLDDGGRDEPDLPFGLKSCEECGGVVDVACVTVRRLREAPSRRWLCGGCAMGSPPVPMTDVFRERARCAAIARRFGAYSVAHLIESGKEADQR